MFPGRCTQKGTHSMKKVSTGTNVPVCPMPITLIGTMVQGRANFMTVAWIARMNMDPPLIAMGVNRRSATRDAALATGTFSVNFPRAEMMEKADYCGMVSGKNTDKSGLFDLFYGELTPSPLIRECPLSFECRVTESRDYATHTMIVGEIVATHLDEDCMSGNTPDPEKIHPLMLTMPDNRYWTLGESPGRAWNAGRSLIASE